MLLNVKLFHSIDMFLFKFKNIYLDLEFQAVITENH
jgi:hypothetical protein